MATVAQDMQVQEHFAVFRRMGFLQVVETEEGVAVVLLGKQFDWSAGQTLLPSLHRFVASEMEAVSHRPYNLLYVNTEFSYFHNSPGIWWLWRTYRALPQQCHESLCRCYVLHADWAVRAAAATLCPWLAGDLWRKLVFVPRAEFLPPALQDAADLPQFVYEHEQELSKHPLIDYGIAADVQETPLPHLASLKAAPDS